MALQASGTPISFTQMQTEFGGSNPISMTEYYGEGTLPSGSSGDTEIKASDFYGQSSAPPNALSATGLQLFTSSSSQTGNWLWFNGWGRYRTSGGATNVGAGSGWTDTHTYSISNAPTKKANIFTRYGSSSANARVSVTGSVTTQLPIIGLNPSSYTPINGSSFTSIKGGANIGIDAETSRRPLTNVPSGLYAVFFMMGIAENTGAGIQNTATMTVHPSGSSQMTVPTTAWQVGRVTASGKVYYSGGAFIMSIGSTAYVSVTDTTVRPMAMIAVPIQ